MKDLARTVAYPFALAALAAISVTSSVVPASAKPVAGTLTCKGEGTVGLILGSSEKLVCIYQVAGKSRVHRYDGTINKVGLDLGVSGKSVLVWTVLGSTSELPGEALDGNFGGLSAEASVAVGVGANALVGGSNNSVVLQPLSVQAQEGVNIAIGVAELRLRYRDSN